MMLAVPGDMTCPRVGPFARASQNFAASVTSNSLERHDGISKIRQKKVLVADITRRVISARYTVNHALFCYSELFNIIILVTHKWSLPRRAHATLIPGGKKRHLCSIILGVNIRR